MSVVVSDLSEPPASAGGQFLNIWSLENHPVIPINYIGCHPSFVRRGAFDYSCYSFNTWQKLFRVFRGQTLLVCVICVYPRLKISRKDADSRSYVKVDWYTGTLAQPTVSE